MDDQVRERVLPTGLALRPADEANRCALRHGFVRQAACGWDRPSIGPAQP